MADAAAVRLAARQFRHYGARDSNASLFAREGFTTFTGGLFLKDSAAFRASIVAVLRPEGFSKASETKFSVWQEREKYGFKLETKLLPKPETFTFDYRTSLRKSWDPLFMQALGQFLVMTFIQLIVDLEKISSPVSPSRPLPSRWNAAGKWLKERVWTGDKHEQLVKTCRRSVMIVRRYLMSHTLDFTKLERKKFVKGLGWMTPNWYVLDESNNDERRILLLKVTSVLQKMLAGEEVHNIGLSVSPVDVGPPLTFDLQISLLTPAQATAYNRDKIAAIEAFAASTDAGVAAATALTFATTARNNAATSPEGTLATTHAAAAANAATTAATSAAAATIAETNAASNPALRPAALVARATADTDAGLATTAAATAADSKNTAADTQLGRAAAAAKKSSDQLAAGMAAVTAAAALTPEGIAAVHAVIVPVTTSPISIDFSGVDKTEIFLIFNANIAASLLLYAKDKRLGTVQLRNLPYVLAGFLRTLRSVQGDDAPPQAYTAGHVSVDMR